MAPMMACKTEAMPLTMAMRQEPMVRNTAVIYCLYVSMFDLELPQVGARGKKLTQDTTAPILKIGARCDLDVCMCGGIGVFV